MLHRKILFFIGAGFSVNLGGYTTYQLAKAIDILFNNPNKTLDERIEILNRDFFGGKLKKNLLNSLKDTLLILLDGNNSTSLAEALKQKEETIEKLIKTYKKYFPQGNEIQFGYYLQNLYKEYDLLAFKSFYMKWASQTEKPAENFVRFLTLVSKAYEEGISIPTEEIFKKDLKRYFNYIYYIRPDRILKALNFFRYLAYKFFKLKLSIRDRNFKKNVKLYLKFFSEILKRYYNLEPNPKNIVKEAFIELPVIFLTTNWDPFLPFLLIKTNNLLNLKVKKTLLPGEILHKFYVDFNLPVFISRLDIKLKSRKNKNFSPIGGYLITNDGAFTVNSHTKKSLLGSSLIDSNVIVSLEKLFAIHGIFNLRVCPYCGKPFFVLPRDIRKIDITTYEGLKDIFLLDPIPDEHDFKIVNKVYKNTSLWNTYLKGRPDEILCPYCKNPSYFIDTPLSIQTIFKVDEHPILKNIKLQGFQKFYEAEHIIVIGYSFPEDDLINNYLIEFLMVSSTQKLNRKISIISYSSEGILQRKTWYYLDELEKSPQLMELTQKSLQIESIKKLFRNKNNIRISFLGFPNILEKTSIEDILVFRRKTS
jgi:hypothetical protein